MQRTTQWDRGYWLAITSKLPSRFTLVKPDLEYNLVEYNLAGNVLLDNYIQGTTTKLTNTQTVKPTGTPVGEDYTTTHQDRITTADGKIYKYVSSTNNTTGKVKLGTTNVANYYTEVKGNVVVDYHTHSVKNLLVADGQLSANARSQMLCRSLSRQCNNLHCRGADAPPKPPDGSWHIRRSDAAYRHKQRLALPHLSRASVPGAK